MIQVYWVNYIEMIHFIRTYFESRGAVAGVEVVGERPPAGIASSAVHARQMLARLHLKLN